MGADGQGSRSQQPIDDEAPVDRRACMGRAAAAIDSIPATKGALIPKRVTSSARPSSHTPMIRLGARKHGPTCGGEKSRHELEVGAAIKHHANMGQAQDSDPVSGREHFIWTIPATSVGAETRDSMTRKASSSATDPAAAQRSARFMRLRSI